MGNLSTHLNQNIKINETIIFFSSSNFYNLISCKNSTKSNQTNKNLKSRIESYLEKCNKNGLSGTVLVAHKGELLFSGGIGLSNQEKNHPRKKKMLVFSIQNSRI